MIDEQVYNSALEFVNKMSAWFTGDQKNLSSQGGRHVRDCNGVVIYELPDLMRAIDEGRWPNSEGINMKYQTYDLRDLDEHTREMLINNEIDKLLENKLCTICGGEFTTRDEKDNAVCSEKNPLSYAHESCWLRRKNDQG